MMNEKNVDSSRRRETFIKLNTPDGENRVWISKTDCWGILRIYLSFNLLHGRMQLVDDMDSLPYVSVVQVHNPHEECPAVALQFTEPNPGHMGQFIDDLCEILDRCLPASGAQAHSPENEEKPKNERRK